MTRHFHIINRDGSFALGSQYLNLVTEMQTFIPYFLVHLENFVVISLRGNCYVLVLEFHFLSMANLIGTVLKCIF